MLPENALRDLVIGEENCMQLVSFVSKILSKTIYYHENGWRTQELVSQLGISYTPVG